MCLETHFKRKVAEENIVVYKILRKITSKEKNKVFYEPPYYWWKRFSYKQGINSVASEKEDLKRQYTLLSGCYTLVEGGFLHAYSDMIHAFTAMSSNFSNSDNFLFNVEYNVYKMIIPKGTEYYVGSYYDICAKELFWEDMTPCEL